ncbi:MAG: glutamate--tRNA ligase [Candidatus Omnitrophica bacterium]|nr:glutamate--tRNA ligase [Candidatus Omnitrophota bacterium]MCM8802458.1 glutamate--tRNA ligase [Candidatus Omnitrophota bacterium]
MVRVRFAPSPTGFLHIGNARTALFNYLFARKNKGKFILRIEDTDKERSKKEYEEAIIEDLKWIGIEWDEGPDIGGEYGPYRQSERIDIYKEFAEKLLKEGIVYKCYCTKEELEKTREDAQKKGLPPGYDGKCRNLTKEKISQYEKEGRSFVLRLKVPEEKIEINDLIRGKVIFEGENLTDFVIMKSDGVPTFNFAVVIDDYLMKITHVIRGEDHLSNTPKHILIFKAIGAKLPFFAHMSMTLGPDRTRLSKRHGATSVRAYREEGYLPEAFFNYISLLGWGTTESKEIFTKEELIEEFSLERCHKASAIFDKEKLLWMNSYYIRKTELDKIYQLSIPFLKKENLIEDMVDKEKEEYIKRAISLEQEKIKTLKEVPFLIEFFLKEPEYEKENYEKLINYGTKKILGEIVSILENIDNFKKEDIEKKIRDYCREKGLKTSDVFHPLRFAVSGRTKGPDLFGMIELLGKEKTVERIKKLVI